MKVLVTGFQPFLSESINPSQMLALDLEKKFTFVKSIILPVQFGNSFQVLKKTVEIEKPDYLIMIGQATGRNKVSFEKIGLNWIQTDNADEFGNKPTPQHIDPSAPLAHMSKFPIDEIYQKLTQKKLPVEISFTAGAFVCNDLYFNVLNRLPEMKSVFIHVPLIAEQIKSETPRPFLDYNVELDVLSELVNCVRGN